MMAGDWPRVIAVDGPAGAGKGTLCRKLADHFGYAMLDTGLLYRATGYTVLQAGGDPANADDATRAARALDMEAVDESALRNETVADAASKVAALPDVRAALLDYQRSFAAGPPAGKAGAILDGRDIGTVVCPDADVKIFITASAEVRAERRFKELQGKGQTVIYARVLEDVKARDERDSGRGVSPMKPATDAFELDTSDLDADGVFAEVMAFIDSRRPR
ncbi:MAG: (d)CMP kinase [Rhodospirillales bacterium]